MRRKARITKEYDLRRRRVMCLDTEPAIENDGEKRVIGMTDEEAMEIAASLRAELAMSALPDLLSKR